MAVFQYEQHQSLPHPFSFSYLNYQFSICVWPRFIPSDSWGLWESECCKILLELAEIRALFIGFPNGLMSCQVYYREIAEDHDSGCQFIWLHLSKG